MDSRGRYVAGGRLQFDLRRVTCQTVPYTERQFFKEEFGIDSKILWLPDVFGYSGALPQIMKECGIEYFMTTKLAWNQIDKFPTRYLFVEGN